MTATRRAVLVTVCTPHGDADVAVAADLPVFQLLPSLIAAANGVVPVTEVERARWQLLAEDGRLLAPRATLAAAGVADGERLRIVSATTQGVKA